MKVLRIPRYFVFSEGSNAVGVCVRLVQLAVHQRRSVCFHRWRVLLAPFGPAKNLAFMARTSPPPSPCLPLPRCCRHHRLALPPPLNRLASASCAESAACRDIPPPNTTADNSLDCIFAGPRLRPFLVTRGKKKRGLACFHEAFFSLL